MTEKVRFIEHLLKIGKTHILIFKKSNIEEIEILLKKLSIHAKDSEIQLVCHSYFSIYFLEQDFNRYRDEDF